MIKSAIFGDNDYRYELRRVFDKTKPLVAFVGLNPSSAGCKEDDPTISKCIKYCESWGFGGFIMVNLFACISTDPKEIYNIKNPVGPDNDNYLKNAFKEVEKVICCWGELGNFNGRSIEVLKQIENPYCLTKLKNGEAGHPLYLKADLKPKPFYETLADLETNDLNKFYEWNGYCPESFLKGEQVRMRHNSNDFYESEKTGLQVAIMFPGVQAVIMNFRGEGKFRQTEKYVDEVFNYEILAKQTLPSPPFGDKDLLQNSNDLKDYMETIK